MFKTTAVPAADTEVAKASSRGVKKRMAIALEEQRSRRRELQASEREATKTVRFDQILEMVMERPLHLLLPLLIPRLRLSPLRQLPNTTPTICKPS